MRSMMVVFDCRIYCYVYSKRDENCLFCPKMIGNFMVLGDGRGFVLMLDETSRGVS